MPQSSINDFFTVATPEQIAQQNQLAWAKLHNHNQAILALQNVTTEQKGIRTIEKQHSDSAHCSRDYRARLKAARKPTTKQVYPYLLLLLFPLLLPYLMTVTLLQKPKLRPPLLSSDLLLPSRNTMEIPLKRASKKQIEAGTAPPRVRAPPHHWFNPNIWPDIAQAAVLSAWSPQGIIKHLTRTPAGMFRFKGLNRGTVWKMMDRNKHGAWSASTISAVEAQRRVRESSKTLGHPRLLVSVMIEIIHILKYPRRNTWRSPTNSNYKFKQCVKMVSRSVSPSFVGFCLGSSSNSVLNCLLVKSTSSAKPSLSPTCTHWTTLTVLQPRVSNQHPKIGLN